MTYTGSSGRTTSPAREHHQTDPAATRVLPQYSLAGVLGTWAAATVPMGLLAWVAAPWLAGVRQGPAPWPRALLVCLLLGLGWQLVLVLALVRHEQGSLRWPVLREALWLGPPRDPRTGRPRHWLWLLVLPLAGGSYGIEQLPELSAPADRDLGTFLGTETGQVFLSGNWTWFALIMAMMVLNTVLGEELLFRGLLLPRMSGVFGRADWVANVVLFAAYHVHVPWAMPGRVLSGALYAWPSRRYRSAYLGIAVHSVQTVVLGVMLLTVVAG